MTAAAIVAVSCNTGKIKLDGRLIGCDNTLLLLESAAPAASGRIVDSVRTDEKGYFKVAFKSSDNTPSLYNLNCNGDRIPLLLAAGDRVTVNSVGSISRNYEVEGSEESKLLKQISFILQDGAYRLDSIANIYGDPAIDDATRSQVLRDYTQEYYRIKREQIRFIVENSKSLAAVYALYQRLPNDETLFNGSTDVVYYRMVADSLEQVYPNSAYLASLRRDIDAMTLLGAATLEQTNYPDLKMPDMFGNDIKLSSLAGKVILVDFWSASTGNSNALNAELKNIYEKYADRGFEVYQIGVDASKAVWINAVQEQKLPWISVCDLQGVSSPALGMYNVQSLPANYLIDREGNIVGKNLYGDDLENQLKSLL